MTTSLDLLWSRNGWTCSRREILPLEWIWNPCEELPQKPSVLDRSFPMSL